MPIVSVVSPVYNERPCLEELARRLSISLQGITQDYEIILIDDGSSDGSWDKISELSRQDRRVQGVRFSRNFGHHLGIAAGLDHSRGDWVVVMDSDLQDLPEAIPDLYKKAIGGFDIVVARRMQRQHGWLKKLLARWFYAVYGHLTDTVHDEQAGVFRIMSRRAVNVLREMREVSRFFPGMVDWIGFPRSHIYVQHGARHAGETKYPLRKQMALAISTILSFSDKPLTYVAYFGLMISMVSLVYGIYIIILALRGGVVVLGYASLAAAIFLVGGVTIFTIGIVGIYVGRVFRQVQGRPLYVVAESTTPQLDVT